jgi:hypothetical protein
VSLTNEDTSGHTYTETAVLDIDAMEGVLFTSVKTIHDIGKSLAEIQKTLESASVLGRTGSIEVEAAVETHEQKTKRVTREMAKRQERLEQMGQTCHLAAPISFSLSGLTGAQGTKSQSSQRGSKPSKRG